MGKKTGLLGGTFNPLHLGHLILGEWARSELGLDQVWFVPNCGQSHRYPKTRPDGVTPETRWELLTAGLKGIEGFVPCDLELKRGGESYTIDTLTELHASHPDRDWYFILGLDALAELHTWKGFPELLNLCRLVSARREGVTKEPDPRVVARTTWLTMPRIEISAALVRERAAAGETLRFLVPTAVEELIREKNLYRPPAGR